MSLIIHLSVAASPSSFHDIGALPDLVNSHEKILGIPN